MTSETHVQECNSVKSMCNSTQSKERDENPEAEWVADKGARQKLVRLQTALCAQERQLLDQTLATKMFCLWRSRAVLCICFVLSPTAVNLPSHTDNEFGHRCSLCFANEWRDCRAWTRIAKGLPRNIKRQRANSRSPLV